MTNSYPNSLDIPSHKLVTYPPGFGLLVQFGCLSADGRLNCGSNESLGTRAIALKSERQIHLESSFSRLLSLAQPIDR
jgi:hypothetical protein